MTIIINRTQRIGGLDYVEGAKLTLAASVETTWVNAGWARWAPGSEPRQPEPVMAIPSDQEVEYFAGGQRVELGGGLTSIASLIRDWVRRTFRWWGDSTTEGMTGNSVIPYALGSSRLFDGIGGYTQVANHGSNGMALSALLAVPQSQLNGGGNVVAPEALGALCDTTTAIVWSFGLNDFRLDTTIAGTYGNAGMLAAVAAFQANAVSCISRLRAGASKSVPVIFRVPNTVALTSASIATGNGLTGQHVTDAIRMAYLGDPLFGVKPLSDLVAKSVVLDVGGMVFGTTSWALASVPTAIMAAGDGLHPATEGLAQVARLVTEFIAAPDDVFVTARVTAGRFENSAATYTDLSLSTIPVAKAFGNTSGTSYGAAAAPVLGIGDVLLCNTPAGASKSIKVTKTPYQNNGESAIRWTGNGIDGAFHESDLPTGTLFEAWRKQTNTVFEAIAKARQRAGVACQIYPVRVEAGGAGTITVRAIPGALSLVDRAPTVTDYIAIPGAGGSQSSAALGQILTGATITAQASPGLYVITGIGSGFNGVAAVGLQGAIIVP